ncbi:MAG: hypothetical protein DWQ04_32760 [Chloroflexi bacterium]|nr:MAG: hypothetical protein DWQ04_32760 [Chloroflexota bacterium]
MDLTKGSADKPIFGNGNFPQILLNIPLQQYSQNQLHEFINNNLPHDSNRLRQLLPIRHIYWLNAKHANFTAVFTNLIATDPIQRQRVSWRSWPTPIT